MGLRNRPCYSEIRLDRGWACLVRKAPDLVRTLHIQNKNQSEQVGTITNGGYLRKTHEVRYEDLISECIEEMRVAYTASGWWERDQLSLLAGYKLCQRAWLGRHEARVSSVILSYSMSGSTEFS